MMHRMLKVLVVLWSAAAVCSAGVVALTPVTGGVEATDARGFMTGWLFSVSTNLVVDGLGYYDVGSNGLGESHDVGIFDSITGDVLVSATVPSGTGGTLVNGFRIVPVSYPLGPGTYVIGGQQSGAIDAVRLMVTAISTITEVTYLEERELVTDDFEVPTTHVLESEMGIFGPTFTVEATGVPEPGTFLGLAAGLAFLGGLRRRRAGSAQQ